MDPIHLLPDELDYELDIRGVFNLATTRQKTTCLREFLNRENRGERTVLDNRIDKLIPQIELSKCGYILENIIKTMQSRSFEAKHRNDCRSRLVHVIQRIKRAKPVSPEEQTIVYEMLVAAEEQLEEFVECSYEGAQQVSKSPVVTKAVSPLADVIEAIRKGQQSFSSQKIVDNEHTAKGSTKSLLNPKVKEFVPFENFNPRPNPFSEANFRIASFNNEAPTHESVPNRVFSGIRNAPTRSLV